MTEPPARAPRTEVRKAATRKAWFFRRRRRFADDEGNEDGYSSSLKELRRLGDPRVEEDEDRSNGVRVLSVEDGAGISVSGCGSLNSAIF